MVEDGIKFYDASDGAHKASADFRASPITGVIHFICFLDAISGTTPPYILCTSICDATTFELTDESGNKISQ